jgi:peptidoglycan/xylan/chitin deacetylase (PgdA/CDA1 family)
MLGKESYVKTSDVKTLYANHEVASHTITHPNLTKCDDEKLRHEVVDDCKALEALVGYPIRGLAYPGGEADERVMKALPGFGIRYARVVGTHHWFAYPKKPYFWVTTCHIGDMLKDGERLMSFKQTPALMAIWGHSYEFNDNKCWNQMEEFGKAYGKRKDIWYAPNIEVMDYYDAAKQLVVSLDGNTVQNPGKMPVWAHIRGKTYELKPGQTTPIAHE